MVFLWIASLTSVPLHVAEFAAAANVRWTTHYALLYVLWVVMLGLLARKIGHFRVAAILLYPLPPAAFLGIFAVSILGEVLGFKVLWKGRAIAREGRSCE